MEFRPTIDDLSNGRVYCNVIIDRTDIRL